MSLNANGEVTALDANGKQQSIKSMIENLRNTISQSNSNIDNVNDTNAQSQTNQTQPSDLEIGRQPNHKRNGKNTHIDENSNDTPGGICSSIPRQTQQDFLALLASLQFAIVVLLVRVRLPFAQSAETFVILSILLITAGHGKLQALLPTGEDIKDKKSARNFLFIVFPIFLYMIVCEIWFLYYLFFQYPDYTEW
eukprot:CAMPEP_0204825494 /NCGR_PEP_ID=MMETSP1346-20131115/3368_1 /ASSEMBLY_ACC=CAM_ASM_000771 /TAXON_ID=215587 /ORGANISM="Aplanochytrium stocchinoi, Strain GSBS06" /LENGTH=194 /DNA_ID=CAMNT_0051953143 /DNA_START=299 /DNA_END=880 /DNA_ORIENTATION=-